MSDYDRLLAIGFTERMAHHILLIFGADREGLELYIRRMEALADV